jgi:hypothetical protein
MRTLPALLLALVALPALADDTSHYAGRDHRQGPARELVHASRQLDDAAGHLYQRLRAERGRSDATHRARDLAEATRDLERLVARNAPPRRLHEAFHRVEERRNRLARQLVSVRWLHRPGPLVAGLRDVDRAADRVESALERRHYAWRDDRGFGGESRQRPDDRREPWPYR